MSFKGVRCIWTCNECDRTTEELVMKPTDGIYTPKPFYHIHDGQQGDKVFCRYHYANWIKRIRQEHPDAVWTA